MYGIIPAAPPPDQSYGLTPRAVGLRGNGGVGDFANQLARENSRSAEPSSGDEGARTESVSDKQRQGAEAAAKRLSDGEAEAKAGSRSSMAKPSREKSDRTTTHTEESGGDNRHAAGTDAAKSDSLPIEDVAELGDQTDARQVPLDVEAKLPDEKHSGRFGGRPADEFNKLATGEAGNAVQDERAPGARSVRQEKSGKNFANTSTEDAAGRASAAAAKGDPSSLKNPHHAGADPEMGTAERVANQETEQTTPHGADADVDTNAKRQNRADSASEKVQYAESLVERPGQSDNSERNRRVRTGQDPRDRRIAAEKTGTQTVEARAVAPVDGENTQVEKLVTRELTVDLSESSAHPRDSGGGAESSLSAGRMEVAFGESSSRPPSVSQATQTLSRRLNGELGNNIVRQAKVMLQDANHAELRLIIRPPELGRIRIRLQMENGHIAGRILVDNGSVREVVEQNLASLQRAFEEAGLEMGDLEVSTGDARDDAEKGSQNQNGSGQRATTAGVESFGRSIETISEYEPGRHRINLVA